MNEIIPQNIDMNEIILENINIDEIIPQNIDMNEIIPQNINIDGISIDFSSINSNNENINDLINIKSFENIINYKIDSKMETEQECYNDYMVTLNKEYNIKNIDIVRMNLPLNTSNNITIENNVFIIETNKIYEFELDEKYYNRYDLINLLNEYMKNENINVECSFNNDEQIQFISNDIFNIHNNENSVLKKLGFMKQFYSNTNEYISDVSINLGDNIYYIFIENLNEKPMFLFNEGKIEKINELNEENSVDYLIIKFYKTKFDLIKNNLEYTHFFDNNHQIEFSFNCY
jgi:hypothetical protein